MQADSLQCLSQESKRDMKKQSRSPYNQPPALLPPGVWYKAMVSFLISSELTIVTPHHLQTLNPTPFRYKSILVVLFVCSSNETQIPEKENLLSNLSQRKNHNGSYKILKPE